MDTAEPTDLERAQQLFGFLQGVVPEGHKIAKKNCPKLTPDQAWTVIWYLGNQYWEVPDFIERCDVCGDLFDSNREGATLDYGKGPYHFCDSCEGSDEFRKKVMRHPDKTERESYSNG